MESWYNEKEGAQQYCNSPRLSNEHISWPAIKELCGEVNGRRVLDLGTAGGETARKVVALGANCTGVDISQEMLKIAREATKNSGLKVEYIERHCGDLDGIPDNEFDITIMNFLLCNVSSIDEIDSIFHEAYRVTKPAGKVIFTMHHPLQLTLKEPVLMDRCLVTNNGPTNYFAHGEKVKRLLRTYNSIITVNNFHWTIQDYIDSFVKSGFLVDAIKEPKPLSPPSKFLEYFDQAYLTPLYLVVRGCKR